MAKLQLADGRRIPLVRPNLWDGAAVEKETGWNRKKYAEMMQLGSVQTAFSIFASLRRDAQSRGESVEHITFSDCMELSDIERFIAEPGDLARAAEGEDEESLDPPKSATVADADAAA